MTIFLEHTNLIIRFIIFLHSCSFFSSHTDLFAILNPSRYTPALGPFLWLFPLFILQIATRQTSIRFVQIRPSRCPTYSRLQPPPQQIPLNSVSRRTLSLQAAPCLSSIVNWKTMQFSLFWSLVPNIYTECALRVEAVTPSTTSWLHLLWQADISLLVWLIELAYHLHFAFPGEGTLNLYRNTMGE